MIKYEIKSWEDAPDNQVGVDWFVVMRDGFACAFFEDEDDALAFVEMKEEQKPNDQP